MICVFKSAILKALTQVLKVLLRVGVSSAFGVLKVELSSRKYYSE